MKKITILLACMFLIGCNGGGGGSSSDSNNLFSLSPVDYYQPGYIETYEVTGSDTGGGKFKGDFFISTKEKIVLDDAIVTPIDQLANLTNTVKDVFISAYIITYYDENKTPVMRVNDTSDITYTPVSISVLPETAVIGSIGPLTTWNGDDGSTITGNWSLEKNDSSSNLADLVAMETVKDAMGEIIAYTENVRTIDKDGVPKSETLKWYYPNTEITVNLSLKKIK